MRHTAILLAALSAGLGRPVNIGADGIERKLYDYARQRKFPPPETLARKAAELAGGDYPYPSLLAAPEAEQVFFTAFRTVTEALEPFHQDDDPNEAQDEAQQIMSTLDQDAERAGAADAADLVNMAIIGRSFMDAIAVHTKPGELLEGWTPAEDPAELVGDLVEMVKLADAERDKAKKQLLEAAKPKEQQKVEDHDKKPDDQVDEVEKKRRAGQAEMDKAIAESGGKFSDDADDKNKKKTK